MNTETSIIVSKIEKLWRKASDAGSSPAERQAFEAKALSLMEENRIEMAMLDLAGEDVLGDWEYGHIKGRYANPIIDIIDAIARAYDCRVWWRNQRGGVKHVHVFGFKSDAERVRLLAQMLVADGQAEAAKEKGFDAGHTYSIRHSFISGYSSAIGQRLREAARMANKAMDEEHGEEAAKGAELVLVSRREQVHEEYSKKRLKSAAPRRVGNGSGYSRGHDAGMSASLSTQGRVAAPARALAS